MYDNMYLKNLSRMQLKEKKNTMERDKRKLEAELDRQRQTIGKQVFMQVVHQRNNSPHQQQQNTHREHLHNSNSTNY